MTTPRVVQQKSIMVTDAMADLVAALEDLLASQKTQPSDPLVRLTEATHRLASSWAEYQQALDPVRWAESESRISGHRSLPNDTGMATGTSS